VVLSKVGEDSSSILFFEGLRPSIAVPVWKDDFLRHTTSDGIDTFAKFHELPDGTDIDTQCRLSKSILDVKSVLVNGSGRHVIHIRFLRFLFSEPLYEGTDVFLVEFQRTIRQFFTP